MNGVQNLRKGKIISIESDTVYILKNFEKTIEQLFQVLGL